jgi:hypothetical protein
MSLHVGGFQVSLQERALEWNLFYPDEGKPSKLS